MNDPSKTVTLDAVATKRLLWEYRETKDMVQCAVLALTASLELVKLKPERLDDLLANSKKVEDKIGGLLGQFERTLKQALGPEKE